MNDAACELALQRVCMSSCRFVLSTLIFVSLFVSARVAFADDLSQFELGKTRFDSGEYDDAANRFASMLDASQAPCKSNSANVTSTCRLTDPELIERARAYYAASLIALDRVEDADAQISEILSKNLQFSPDPAMFPQKVVDRFTTVRARRRQELEAAEEKRLADERAKRFAEDMAKQAEQRWLDSVLKQAAEERVVVKNSRLIASLPFGIGQFQNGNRTLGWTFAISQGVLAATTIITSQTYNYYATYAPNLPVAAEGNLISLRLNQAAFGTFGALAIAGIIHAHLTFVPEKVVIRERAVPPRPTTTALQFVPTIGLSPNMVGVGVLGTF